VVSLSDRTEENVTKLLTAPPKAMLPVPVVVVVSFTLSLITKAITQLPVWYYPAKPTPEPPASADWSLASVQTKLRHCYMFFDILQT
jgi:hypothetical protein